MNPGPSHQRSAQRGRGGGSSNQSSRLSAAVPAYAQGYMEMPMPPGHKFELFFPVWNEAGWEMSKNEKSKALKKTVDMKAFKTMLEEILRRQICQAELCGQALLSIEAEATAPFLTGIGLEHPLENGFSFLKPYGLPYLPGSGIKGVLKKACEELALSGRTSGPWNIAEVWALFGFEGGSFYLAGRNGGSNKYLKERADTLRKAFENWVDSLNTEETRPLLEPLIEQGAASAAESQRYKNDLKLFLTDLLTRSDLRERIHNRGSLVFWDVFPQLRGDALSLDILTPHYSHYYHGGKPPHDSGQPVPNPFLTVPAGSLFRFNIQYAPAEALDLPMRGTWKELIRQAAAYAFDWLGFGAKTAVGYGQMKAQESQREHPAPSPDKPLPLQPPERPPEPKGEVWENAYLSWNPGNKTITATNPQTRKKAEGKGEQLVPKELLERLKKKKPVVAKVVVEPLGTAFRVISIGS